MSKQKKMTIGIDDYIKANKRLAREEELQRNGGRWVAKDRPHKNLKKYDRKRDKKNFDSYLFLFFFPDKQISAKEIQPPFHLFPYCPLPLHQTGPYLYTRLRTNAKYDEQRNPNRKTGYTDCRRH